jgi:hypothetical protein
MADMKEKRRGGKMRKREGGVQQAGKQKKEKEKYLPSVAALT